MVELVHVHLLLISELVSHLLFDLLLNGKLHFLQRRLSEKHILLMMPRELLGELVCIDLLRLEL